MENMKMKSQDIEKLSEYILKIKKEYDFLFENSVDTEKFIEAIIKKNITKYSTLESFKINILIKQIRNEIESYIQDKIEKDTNINSEGIKMLSRFIDRNILSYNIDEINKLENLFNKVNYKINLEICKNLLKTNKKLNVILENYFESNQELIVNDEIELITSDVLKLKLVKAYCIINNIKINKNENKELETNSSYENVTISEDIVKIYLDESKKYPIRNGKEQIELIHEIKKGNREAFDTIILSNYALVVYIAKRYRGKGVDFDDLIQIGTMGLIDAIKKYDETKDTKFSTYAIYWIRQKITRYIADNSRNIRIPDKKHFELQKLTQKKDLFVMKYGYMPSLDDISSEMNLKAENVLQLEKLENNTVSLNSIVKSDGETELEEFVAIDDINLNNILKPDIIDLFAKINLTPRQIHMLLLSYGIMNGKSNTLQEIGDYYGLTKERIRQIEAKSIRRIKSSPIRSELLSIIDVDEDLTTNQMQKIKLINDNEKRLKLNLFNRYNLDKKTINKLLRTKLNIVELEFIIPILGLGNCELTSPLELSKYYKVKIDFVYYMLTRSLKKIDEFYDRHLFYDKNIINNFQNDQVLKKILK